MAHLDRLMGVRPVVGTTVAPSAPVKKVERGPDSFVSGARPAAPGYSIGAGALTASGPARLAGGTAVAVVPEAVAVCADVRRTTIEGLQGRRYNLVECCRANFVAGK